MLGKHGIREKIIRPIGGVNEGEPSKNNTDNDDHSKTCDEIIEYRRLFDPINSNQCDEQNNNGS